MPQVEIQIDADTLQDLQVASYTLYVLKAVATEANGALPVLWFQIPPQALSANTIVSWSDQYAAFCSGNILIPRGAGRFTGQTDINPGEAVVFDGHGKGSVSTQGPADAISLSTQLPPWPSGGVSQSGNSQMNPIVWLTLPQDGSAVSITPVDKVLLWFGLNAYPVEVGSNFPTTPQIAVLVDLTDGSKPTVSYDMNDGWHLRDATGELVTQGVDIVPMLIFK